MPLTPADIADFSQFAREQIHNGGSQLSLSQLAQRWEAARERAAVVAAIREGLDDIEAGRTQDAFEALEELRKKHNIARDA
jgi:hypothetical protein